VFLRTVFGWQRRCAARRGLVGVRSGSVTAIQRFGGSANLNVHFHALLFDGVYTRASPTARPRFHRLPPPTDADIAPAAPAAPPPRATTPDPPRTVVGRGRRERPVRGARAAVRQRGGGVAPGPGSAGAAGRTAGAPPALAAAVTATGRRSARLEGFSLHADVAVPARRRDQLERLVRYLVRPPLALDRLRAGSCGTSSAGRGVMARRRSSWTPWNCWNGWRPWCPRCAGRCSRATACWPRAPASERPWCRRRRRPPRGR
jgi:hypothetical protein